MKKARWPSNEQHTATGIKKQKKKRRSFKKQGHSTNQLTQSTASSQATVSAINSSPNALVGKFKRKLNLSLVILADIKLDDLAPNRAFKNIGGILIWRLDQPNLQKSPGIKYWRNLIWRFKPRPPNLLHRQYFHLHGKMPSFSCNF